MFLLLRGLIVGALVALLNWSAASAERGTSTSGTQSSLGPGVAISEDWEFATAPYIWFVNLDGNITLDGVSAPVDIGFGTIAEELNLGFMGQFEVRKDRAGAFFNPVFASLADSQSAGPFDVGGETIPEREIDATLNLFVSDIGFFYRALDVAFDGGLAAGGSNLIVEPFVGARVWSIWGNLSVPTSTGNLFLSGHELWADAIVGARTHWYIDEQWNLALFGDIGTGASDFTGQGIAFAGYRFGIFQPLDSNLLVGYRALYDNYSTGSGSSEFTFRATLHGPLLGLSLRF